MNRRRHAAGLRRLVLLAALLCTAPAHAESSLSLAGGTEASDDQAVAVVLCRLYDDGRPATLPACIPTTSAGSVANVEALRAGARPLALVQSDVAEAALHASPPFGGHPPFGELRAVMALHVALFVVLARRDADIASFADLKGRRVAVPPRGSGGRATFDKVVQYHGWGQEKAFARVIETPADELGAALCEGRADAAIAVAGQPDASLAAAAGRCATRLVSVAGPPIERLLRRYAVYRALTIPGRLYPGNAAAVPTIGLRVLLVAPAALDGRVVGRMVQTTLGNVGRLRAAHPSLEGAEARDLVPRGGLPLHPGARDAYRAAGLGG
jgi:TRAP transporter TAXI family solute receptor